ncbi:MAG: hypothetical protein Q7V53_06930 [Caldisericota bacterium]|nr:hypothetical protein [Caldisericota bacterium]
MIQIIQRFDMSPAGPSSKVDKPMRSDGCYVAVKPSPLWIVRPDRMQHPYEHLSETILKFVACLGVLP